MVMHPFIAALVDQASKRPALSDGTIHDARRQMTEGRAAIGAGPQMHHVQDLAIPTRNGQITARLFKPTDNPCGVVVYLHGGGWAIGEIDDFDALCRTLALASGCAVLLPAYRLAPESPFPAGLDDCRDCVAWMSENMAQMFGSRLPLILVGDSAGANLATVLCRQSSGIEIALNVLIYPAVDCDMERQSYVQHGEHLPLKRRDMVWLFDFYAPRPMLVHPDISPLRSTDLSRLPPTSIITAEYDLLADEGSAYAAALKKAGVTVNFRQVPGVTHGFIRLHNLLDVARIEVEKIAQEIRSVCRA